MGMSAFYGLPKLVKDMICLIHEAVNMGVTFQDTPDMYGPHTDEILVGKIAVVDIPNSLLEEQGRQMYAAKLIELQATGKLSKDQVVSLSSAEMVNNYLRAQKDAIADSVKQSLAAAEIFKLEKLEYTDAELDKEVKDAIAEFKRYNQEYDEAKVKEQAKEMLEGLKTTNWLIEHSEMNYVTKGSK